MSRRIAQTKQLPLAELTPFPANPRRGDVAAIRESLAATGQYRALVVRADTREVLAGNHTLAAMRELGWEKALVHLVEVDDETARRIVLADNRTAELASYDEEALAALLQEMDELQGTGWDQASVDELLASLNGAGEGEDTEPGPVPDEPRTKAGDLWLLGDHRLLCGDATVAADVERLMGGGVAVLVATDPPYGVDYANVVGGRKNQKKGGWRDIAGDALADDPLFELVKAALDLSNARTLFLWHAAKRSAVFLAAIEATGWELAQQIIWVKNALVFGGSDYQWRHEPCFYARRKGSRCDADRTATTVWEFSKEHAPAHPTQKPVEVYEIPLRRHTLAGEGCYDPFAGSGSALIAAENLSRRCYAMEIDPGYCDVIVDRFERHTGQTATLAP